MKEQKKRIDQCEFGKGSKLKMNFARTAKSEMGFYRKDKLVGDFKNPVH